MTDKPLANQQCTLLIDRSRERVRHTDIRTYMQGQTDMQIYIQINRQTDRQDLYINQSISILLMDRQTDRLPRLKHQSNHKGHHYRQRDRHAYIHTKNCLHTSGKKLFVVWSNSWCRMSTLPTLGPTLPVTMSRTLKISNEPNLQRETMKLTYSSFSVYPSCIDSNTWKANRVDWEKL